MAGTWRQRKLSGAALPVPVQAVLFVALADRVVADQHLEDIQVDHGAIGPLRYHLGEQRSKLFNVGRHDVGGTCIGIVTVEFLHIVLSHSHHRNIESNPGLPEAPNLERIGA